jgi:hypothetical protein
MDGVRTAFDKLIKYWHYISVRVLDGVSAHTADNQAQNAVFGQELYIQAPLLLFPCVSL